MTIDDMKRLASLPQDPAAPGFGRAAQDAGAALALAASENRGLRAALLEAVELVIVGIAAETDRPRATVDLLVADLGERCVDLLALTGKARRDA